MTASQSQNNSPIKIEAIDHIVIRIVDLGKMLDFYCGVLGCEIERREENIGLIQLRAGSALIDLVPVDGTLGAQGGAAPGKGGRNMDHFCLRLAQFDVEAISRYLDNSGVPPGEVKSRYGAQGQGPSIYIKDPEGNVVELKGDSVS